MLFPAFLAVPALCLLLDRRASPSIPRPTEEPVAAFLCGTIVSNLFMPRNVSKYINFVNLTNVSIFRI